MNRVDKQYIELVEYIIRFGYAKNTRNGKVLSSFGHTFRHNMKEGFPLLTTKNMRWFPIITELFWFLKGDTNIRYLLLNNCNIWLGDLYESYKRRVQEDLKSSPELINHPHYNLSKEEFKNLLKDKNDHIFYLNWGDLGPIYGKQWRSWTKVPKAIFGTNITKEETIDQIANLVNELKTSPDSRRLLVSAWNVSDLNDMSLPPCHYGFQVYTRELSISERVNLFMQGKKVERFLEKITDKDLDGSNIPTRSISLMWNQRSVDVPLGLPFNIASYGLLLELLAKEVNMIPDQLIGNLGDCHIYENQLEAIKIQLDRDPYDLPNIKVLKGINASDWSDIQLTNYKFHPAIEIPTNI